MKEINRPNESISSARYMEHAVEQVYWLLVQNHDASSTDFLQPDMFGLEATGEASKTARRTSDGVHALTWLITQDAEHPFTHMVALMGCRDEDHPSGYINNYAIVLHSRDDWWHVASPGNYSFPSHKRSFSGLDLKQAMHEFHKSEGGLWAPHYVISAMSEELPEVTISDITDISMPGLSTIAAANGDTITKSNRHAFFINHNEIVLPPHQNDWVRKDAQQ